MKWTGSMQHLLSLHNSVFVGRLDIGRYVSNCTTASHRYRRPGIPRLSVSRPTARRHSFTYTVNRLYAARHQSHFTTATLRYKQLQHEEPEAVTHINKTLHLNKYHAELQQKLVKKCQKISFSSRRFAVWVQNRSIIKQKQTNNFIICSASGMTSDRRDPAGCFMTLDQAQTPVTS